jgi:hypothetical protein
LSFQGFRDRVIRHSGKKNRQCDFITVSGRGTVKEHTMFCGSPRQVADQMEEWFTAPACDGFVLAASSMPGAYDDVVRLLVPELQRRGLFQKDYAGPTLRDNLGLAIPRAADWHEVRRARVRLKAPLFRYPAPHASGAVDMKPASPPLRSFLFAPPVEPVWRPVPWNGRPRKGPS